MTSLTRSAASEGSTRAGVAERALADSEEKYRLLVDAIGSYAFYMLDPVGNVRTWNAGAERIKGYAGDEIIGKNYSRFFPDAAIAAGRPAEILRLAAEAGRHQEQGMRVRKDGSKFLADLTCTALRDSAGSLLGFAEFSHDLSESGASEARYRGLLEAAPDAMIVVNEAGDIVLLNVQAEKQFGYRRDELIGQPVTNIIPEGFAERLIADGTRSAADALAQQIGTGIELVARRKDGTEFAIEIMLSPLDSVDGILVTAAIRDISVRNAAEAHLASTVDDLRRSNEELEHFAYVASHDLQEPLRMVSSYTQLLARRYAGQLDADADEFIAFAVDGAARMQQLIQDLLTYSRVGTKGSPLVETPSERALAQALLNIRATIEETGAQVTYDPMPVVLADEAQLAQLFQNLIGNGIKYQHGEAPRVHVGVEGDGEGGWTFAVRDNGIGIEPQYFERIFGMFQRLHGRDDFSGTGIGLAICRKIVERHGGTISVESEPGTGSTFRFALAAGVEAQA
ncbi:MAG: sensor histidine kinase [Candidatus Limnocylindria bacterium]